MRLDIRTCNLHNAQDAAQLSNLPANLTMLLLLLLIMHCCHRRHLLQGAPQGPKPTPATPAATAPGTPAKPQPAPAATAKPAPVAPKAPGNATAPAGKTIPTAGPGGKRNATGNATAAGQGARMNFDMGDEAAFV